MAFPLNFCAFQFKGETETGKTVISTYADLLRSCTRLNHGKLLHSSMTEKKLDRNLYLRKLLVKMYLNSGSVTDAWSIFREMPSEDVVLWTQIMVAYNKKDQHKQALEAFSFMLLEGFEPDQVAFLPVLEASAALSSLRDGTAIHSCILETSLELTLILGNSLINMYGKCSSFASAQKVFDELQERNMISWTALCVAYGQCGMSDEALSLFHGMQLDGVRPSRISFVAVLSNCVNSIDHEEALKIHNCIRESGCELELYIGNAMVNMYGKCGRAEAASGVFDRMIERDVVTWTAMISAYAQQGRRREVFETSGRMQLEGVKPNLVTFITLLNACEKPSSLAMGKQVRSLVIEAGFDRELIVANATVNMFGKCGSVEDANEVFNGMAERDVISWNAIISAYAHRTHHLEPLRLFQQMEAEDVIPNKVTFVAVLFACGRLKALDEGRALHARIVEAGLASDVIIGTALVNFYAKCEELEEARLVFDKIRREDVIAWNSIIGAYAEAGRAFEALELLDKMEAEGMIANEVTYISVLNGLSSPESLQQGRLVHELILKKKLVRVTVETALLNMYTRCGSLGDAERLFHEMQQQDIVSWTSMITGYHQHGEAQQALETFRRMQLSGVKPDRAALVIIFKVCSEDIGLLQDGKNIHAALTGSGSMRSERETEVWNAVINMYGKSKCVEAARSVFDSIYRRDSGTWSAIILTYAQNGEHSKALALFEQQDEESRSRVGYVCAFTACASLRSLSRGMKIHLQAEEAGLQFDGVVVTALVDMYGKCGCLEEAKKVFEGMIGFQKDLVLWTSMMLAYAQNGRGREALEIFWRLQQEGEEPDAVVFLAAFSACSCLGLADEGLDYFAMLKVDYEGVEVSEQHRGCLVDLLGRAGRLEEAERLVRSGGGGGAASNSVMWMSVLGGCRIHEDVERGVRAAESIMDWEPEKSAAYVILANMHRTSESSAAAA